MGGGGGPGSAAIQQLYPSAPNPILARIPAQVPVQAPLPTGVGDGVVSLLAQYGLQQLQAKLQMQQGQLPPPLQQPQIPTQGQPQSFQDSTAYMQQALGQTAATARSPTSSAAKVPHVAAKKHKKTNYPDKEPKSKSPRSNRKQSTNNSSSDNKSSVTNGEASWSSMSTLATVKKQIEVAQDGGKKEELSDISTSGSSDDKFKKSPNDSGASSTSENDTSSSPRKRSAESSESCTNSDDKSSSSSSKEGPPNKKVRGIDPSDNAVLEKQNSGSDSGDLSSASDWASKEGEDRTNEAQSSTSSTATPNERKGVYTSEMSSVSASGSDRSSDAGSDNGSGSAPRESGFESHSSIANLLDAARATDKKNP